MGIFKSLISIYSCNITLFTLTIFNYEKDTPHYRHFIGTDCCSCRTDTGDF